MCYRGINQQKFNPKLKEKKNFLNTFLGYDAKRKELEHLLKILPELPARVKLLVAGKEDFSSERIRYFFR